MQQVKQEGRFIKIFSVSSTDGCTFPSQQKASLMLSSAFLCSLRIKFRYCVLGGGRQSTTQKKFLGLGGWPFFGLPHGTCDTSSCSASMISMNAKHQRVPSSSRGSAMFPCCSFSWQASCAASQPGPTRHTGKSSALVPFCRAHPLWDRGERARINKSNQMQKLHVTFGSRLVLDHCESQLKPLNKVQTWISWLR